MEPTGQKTRPYWRHWMFHVDFGARAPGRVVRRFQVRQIEFDIAFFEDILAHNPTHLEAMRTLAELYTRTGRFRAGLQIDRRVVAAKPRDPVAHYNLACSLALTGRLDECFQVLRQALRLGYRDVEYMSADSDLDAAQKDPRWQRLFDRIEV